MSRKNAEAVARAADEAYAHMDDPADGEVVDVAVSTMAAVVSIRMAPDDLAAVEQAAQRAGTTVSAFVRQAAVGAARDEVVVSRAAAVAAVEAVEQALEPLRRAAGHHPSRLSA